MVCFGETFHRDDNIFNWFQLKTRPTTQVRWQFFFYLFQFVRSAVDHRPFRKPFFHFLFVFFGFVGVFFHGNHTYVQCELKQNNCLYILWIKPRGLWSVVKPFFQIHWNFRVFSWKFYTINYPMLILSLDFVYANSFGSFAVFSVFCVWPNQLTQSICQLIQLIRSSHKWGSHWKQEINLLHFMQ